MHYTGILWEKSIQFESPYYTRYKSCCYALYEFLEWIVFFCIITAYLEICFLTALFEWVWYPYTLVQLKPLFPDSIPEELKLFRVSELRLYSSSLESYFFLIQKE